MNLQIMEQYQQLWNIAPAILIVLYWTPWLNAAQENALILISMIITVVYAVGYVKVEKGVLGEIVNI